MNSKTKQNLIFLLAFAALVAAAATNAARAQSTEWAVEVVDSGADVGIDNVLAYDPAGNPAIAYRDKNSNQVKFAHFNGSSWDIEAVGAVSGETGVSLAYDGEQPTVSYTSNGLYFARYGVSGWVSELVDGSVGDGLIPVSLAYDDNGNPAISYRADEKGGTVLKFAHWNGASWDIEIIADEPRHISLVYDMNGKPAIAYMYMIGNNRKTRVHFVKLARHNGSSWDIETVDSIPDVAFYIDLAFDTGGLPSIVYCKSVDDLHFAHYNGSSWDFERIDGGMSPSLAYAGDTAFVSYVDILEFQLKVAQRDEVNNWEIEVVDLGGSGSNPSIAIDPAAYPAVGYEDGENHNLKFARRVPFNAPPTVTIISPVDGTTFDSGAMIDFLGTASDLEDGDLTDYLAWESDIDGYIGAGGYVQATLSDGLHTITASVTDSGGKTGDASVVITVGELPSLHVEDIAMNSGKAGPNYYALATVWIIDDFIADVEGATVYGQWSGAVSGTATGVTDADGKVTLQSPKKKKGGTFIFTVTDVVLSGYIYSPDDNVEIEDSITVP